MSCPVVSLSQQYLNLDVAPLHVTSPYSSLSSLSSLETSIYNASSPRRSPSEQPPLFLSTTSESDAEEPHPSLPTPNTLALSGANIAFCDFECRTLDPTPEDCVPTPGENELQSSTTIPDPANMDNIRTIASSRPLETTNSTWLQAFLENMYSQRSSEHCKFSLACVYSTIDSYP